MKKLSCIYISLIIIASFFVIMLNINFNLSLDKEIDIPVNALVNNSKIVYLTFDDGPSESTSKILEILDKYDIQATFFLVGPSYKLKNDLLKEIVSNGHSLAIHSYSHDYSQIYKDQESYLKDFYSCLNWIKKETNITPLLYRFPGGSSTTIASKDLIVSIIDELYSAGYKHIDWNVDSADSNYNNNTNAIIKNTINCIKVNESNNIYIQNILMHDNTKKIATLEALPTIIEYCLSKEYQFKTLNENSHLIQHVKRSP